MGQTVITLQQKYVATLNASSGNRIRLENRYKDSLVRSLTPMYSLLSRLLVEDNFLAPIARQANLAKRVRYNRTELKEASRQATAFMTGYQIQLSRSSAANNTRSTIRNFNYSIYSFGAVTAARGLGFEVKSNVVDALLAAKADPVKFELTDQEIIAQLEGRVTRFGRDLSAEVIEDARDIIRDEMFLGDSGIDDVARAIAASHRLKDWRGLKIARTETQEAFQSAQYEMYRRSGVPRHTWFTVGDDRVRPEHNDNDGVEVEIGKEFPSGQLHPGDNTGGLAVNCRCSAIPDLSNIGILLEPWDGSGFMDFRHSKIR